MCIAPMKRTLWTGSILTSRLNSETTLTDAAFATFRLSRVFTSSASFFSSEYSSCSIPSDSLDMLSSIEAILASSYIERVPLIIGC